MNAPLGKARSRTIDSARLERTAAYILGTQAPDGSIPWFGGGITDPWDHTEAAMGLSVAGHLSAAERAYDWLRRQQRPDGAWFAAYRDGCVVDATRAETNFVAYAATGVWHHYLISRNESFLARLWPTVREALDFVIGLQAATGEIYWALDSRTGINKDALVTGCSSIYKSLECGLLIGATLQEADGARDRWTAARDRLGECLRDKPDRFDRTWPSKARYSMDWFYPVLTGAVSGDDARQRLALRWDEFVEPGVGCRCVADEPWVTVAESCELCLALVATGDHERAQALFDMLAPFEAEDGSWWTGYVFRDETFWPDERPTWTAGAVMLAADALLELTPANRLLTGTQP